MLNMRADEKTPTSVGVFFFIVFRLVLDVIKNHRTIHLTSYCDLECLESTPMIRKYYYSWFHRMRYYICHIRIGVKI